MSKPYLKLGKYLRGTAKALEMLADEICVAKKLDKDHQELLSKIGAQLLFHAKTYDYLTSQ